jgi:peptidyl-prolyl cis-trans isomerase B (cyclophilin B)
MALSEIFLAHLKNDWTVSHGEVTPVEIDKSQIDPSKFTETDEQTNYVKITLSGGVSGDVYVRLYPDQAPLTVANFQKLVSEGFYSGLTFHRSVKDFCLQGGDPKGDGTGGAPDKIKGEFLENGWGNHLHHLTGVVSMARSGAPDSASSQFFFTLSDSAAPSLDGKYAAFGYVVAGWDVIEEAVKIPTNSNDLPSVAILMEKITFVTPVAE